MPMGQNTTTFNIDELISSYIDNQITDHELKLQIEEKLRTDEKLNAKYKSELLTKNLLRTRLPQAELPEETFRKVNSSIENLIALSANRIAAEKKQEIQVPEYPSFWQSIKESITAPFLGLPRYAYAAATIFLIIGAVFVFSGKKQLNPYITSGTDKSIMVQAVNSFHKILDGEVIPQFSSSKPAEVEKFVSEKSNFRPYLPNIENYVLTGVVCNEYNGQKLAHIIYRSSKGDIIYIYQTPVTAVVKKDLDLPQDVHNEIVKTRYYMCDGVDETDCTMTLWIKDNVVCASMTNMPKQKMQAAFTSFYK